MNEATTEVAGPAPEPPRRDIYELLGVTPGVTPALARQIYWAHVERSQEALQRGDSGAAVALEELNTALTIILDDGLRAEYDREHGHAAAAVAHAAPRFERSRRIRAGIVLGLVLLTVSGAVAAAAFGDRLAIGVVVSVGMLAMIGALTWPQRPSVMGQSPFTVLGLSEDAGPRELDLAYQTMAQEWLSRVSFDPRAIARLELLDCAYLLASRAVQTQATTNVRPGLVARGVRGLSGAVFRLLGALLGVLGSVALVVLRWVRGAGDRAARATGRRLRLTSARGLQVTAQQFSTLSHRIAREGPPPPSVDIEHRLGAGLRRALPLAAAGPLPGAVLEGPGLAAAPSPTPVSDPPDVPADEALLDVYLVLEAAAGRRRVPIGGAPISIGSSADSDLSLPADLGVEPEHALVWQRDGAVLLHVIAPEGNCMVNEQPMTWGRLEDGDAIALGKVRFLVEFAASA